MLRKYEKAEADYHQQIKQSQDTERTEHNQ